LKLKRKVIYTYEYSSDEEAEPNKGDVEVKQKSVREETKRTTSVLAAG
jgi:hypothetical protein